jgi:hypothetical protein
MSGPPLLTKTGTRKARQPNSPQAGTWISVEPGYEVIDGKNFKSIAIKHNGVAIH